MRTDYDTPWKLMLEKYFQHLLEFLFPHIASEIDWQKPFEHLDKELLAIQKNAKIRNKLSDKLIKVYKKTGREAWVIIHIEVQGNQQSHFAERLFQYYYRIFNRYRMPLVTLAILTDDKKNWRPNEYCRELWGCDMTLKFPIIKLTDYISREEILEKSRNPFAKVVQAHLAALESKGDIALKFQHKLRLVKNLYSLGYNREDIQALYEFIDYVLSLPANQEKEFITEMQKFEEEVKMPYISSAERIGMERGMERGMEKGIQILLALSKHFRSGIPLEIIERVEKASPEELKQWSAKILEGQFEIEELA